MKKCESCAIQRPRCEFWKRAAAKDGLQNRCKDCQRRDQRKRKPQPKSRQWQIDNADRIRRYKLEWARRNPEKARAWQFEHAEAYAEMQKKRSKAEADNLTDRYVAGLLGIHPTMLPQDMIEAKRAHLRIIRLLKERK